MCMLKLKAFHFSNMWNLCWYFYFTFLTWQKNSNFFFHIHFLKILKEYNGRKLKQFFNIGLNKSFLNIHINIENFQVINICYFFFFKFKHELYSIFLMFLIYKTTLYCNYERQLTSQTRFSFLRYSTLFSFTLILTSTRANPPAYSCMNAPSSMYSIVQ